jgi:hypothetical protein
MIYTLKLFANSRILKQIEFSLLLRFLTPFRDCLETKRELAWTEEEENFPFSDLARILMSPDPEMPYKMLNSLA